MSSPRKSCGPNEIREGTRFVLKEITASLHNSQTSPRKSGNESGIQKSPEHVKVQFAREFADVKKTAPSVTESLSSASSFQSLSSTLSSKSSSGICADSFPGSPVKSANTSYVNSDIPGLDDLISACADIKINDNYQAGIEDLSQDQTFASACGDLSITEEEDEEVNFTEDCLKEDTSLKDDAKLNTTFDFSNSEPPENSLSSLKQFPVENKSVSCEDSVRAHDLQNIDKNSLVFSTAVEFQNLEGFAPKIIEDKTNFELNVSRNDSLEQSNSITESGFNASIESQKNVSLNLIEPSISSLEISQFPSIPLLNFSINLETPNENERAASPKLESITPVKVAEEISSSLDSVKIVENIPVHLEQSNEVAEEIPVLSEQINKVDEEILVLSEQINKVDEILIHSEHIIKVNEIPVCFKESIKVAEEIPVYSKESIKVAEEIPVHFEENIKVAEEVLVHSKESIKVAEEIPIHFKESIKVAEEILVNSEEIIKSAEEIPVCSQQSHKVTEEIPICPQQSVQVIEEIPVCPQESIKVTEEFPVCSQQSIKITEEIPIDLEHTKVTQEILNNSETTKINGEIVDIIENDLNSTFPINLNLENKCQTSEQDLKSPELDKIEITPKSQISEGIFNSPSDECKQNTSYSEPEKNKKSPIPQSILDKVAEQQKALDDIFTVDPPNSIEKSPGVHKTNLRLSTIIESPPNFESPQQTNILANNTVILSSDSKQKEIGSISLEKLSDTNNDTVDSSSEIVFLRKSSLESTIVTVNNQKEIPSLSNKIEDKTNLEKSLNLLIKEEESPVKIVDKEANVDLFQSETPKRPTEKSRINETVKRIQEDIKRIEKAEAKESEEASAPVELDSTIILESSEIDLEASDIIIRREDDYETFKPQQQSTNLALADFASFDKLELEAQAIAQDIYNKSVEIADENEQFISATSELFQDPTSFDFLLSQGSSNIKSRDLRFESLYVKFDPLVNNSMLPQGNSQTEEEEQTEKNETPTAPSSNTPMRNPAIAAIDRLLFYSPITPGNKTEPTKDIKEESETVPQEIPVVDEKMAKELELVRTLVVQLEEKLEKVEKEREEDKKKFQKDLKKQQDECRKYDDKNSKLETTLAQELESKKQLTTVLDEYERSISRLVAERGRDRGDQEEKERLKEELQTATQHLSNTEAAFNDVHQKYERLKNVVAAYKSNELVLKDSHKENLETISMLEKKYENLKAHAMAQLEKANHELETIRKQNEAEKVKLQAMLKKAELKSKSLADLVEQKTIENKELTKILDEVIARVGNKNED